MLTKPFSLTHIMLAREYVAHMNGALHSENPSMWVEDFCRRWNTASMEPLTQETVSGIARVA